MSVHDLYRSSMANNGAPHRRTPASRLRRFKGGAALIGDSHSFVYRGSHARVGWQGNVRVNVDWEAIAHSPVRIMVTGDIEKIRSWYTCWFLGPDGEVSVHDVPPGTPPLTIGEACNQFDRLLPARQAAILEHVADLRRSAGVDGAAGASPVGFSTMTCHLLGSQKELVLDSNHRFLALCLADVPFRVHVFSVHGPLDGAMCPELAPFIRRANLTRTLRMPFLPYVPPSAQPVSPGRPRPRRSEHLARASDRLRRGRPRPTVSVGAYEFLYLGQHAEAGWGHGVRVVVDWERIRSMPLRTTPVCGLDEIAGWSTTWYLGPDGKEVEADTAPPGARPLTLAEAWNNVEALRPERQQAIAEAVAELQAEAAVPGVTREVNFSTLTYHLDAGRELILDRCHRLVALGRANVPFAIHDFSLHGPIDPTICSHLAAFPDAPGTVPVLRWFESHRSPLPTDRGRESNAPESGLPRTLPSGEVT